jgi:hypothetical protein
MLLKHGRKTMKKAIWILFIFAALVWTAFAFAASGLARWTSDAIAAAPNSNSSWATATETATTAVTAPVNEAVSAATSTIGKLGANVPPLPALPPMPPVPEWVNQWLTPEWTQSLREWGAWAKAAAGSPQTANVPNSATNTAPAATATGETLGATSRLRESNAAGRASTRVGCSCIALACQHGGMARANCMGALGHWAVGGFRIDFGFAMAGWSHVGRWVGRWIGRWIGHACEVILLAKKRGCLIVRKPQGQMSFLCILLTPFLRYVLAGRVLRELPLPLTLALAGISAQ